MNEWKEALRLAKFEWKASWLGLGPIYAVFITWLFWDSLRENFTEDLYDHLVAPDYFFLFFFLFIGGVSKATRAFSQKPINTQYLVSPQLVLLKELAAPRTLIAKRNIILWAIQTIPWQIMMWLLLYRTIPELSQLIDPAHYAAFCLLWTGYGFAAGGIIPAFDIAPNIPSWLYVILIFFIIGLSTVPITLIIYFSDHNLLYWTMQAANHAPILTACASILGAFFSLRFWFGVCKRRIHQADLF